MQDVKDTIHAEFCTVFESQLVENSKDQYQESLFFIIVILIVGFNEYSL